MSFINPGMLGTQSYFRSEFQVPIEKKGEEAKAKKLNAVIKPFVLRRHKSQVATELPEKVEHIQYSIMTTEQEKRYEEVKSYYRGKILDHIDKEGLGNSRFMILEGLTKLRQLANHPKMIAAQKEIFDVERRIRREALKVVDGLQGQAKIAAARALSLRLAEQRQNAPLPN